MNPIQWRNPAGLGRILLAFGVASLAVLATSCTSHVHPFPPPYLAPEAAAPVQIRIVAVRPEAQRTKVDIEVVGRGSPGAAVCLGYPSFRFRQGERTHEYGTVGNAGACATPRLPAAKGDITHVPVEVVAFGLPTRDGALRLQFPVFVIAPGAAQYRGDIVSPEFGLSSAATGK